MTSPAESTKSSSWKVFVILVAAFWGHYGIVAKFSQTAFHHQAELTFFLICIMYAVGGLLGVAFVRTKGDPGVLPGKSIKWSAVAGISGAAGAVFVILAMKTGNPVYVMPLVFGPAQVFNVVFTRIFQGRFGRKPNRLFWGSLLVIVVASWLVQSLKGGASIDSIFAIEFGEWLAFALLAATCWGLYGVSARLALMSSAAASPGGHGSHLKPLLVVCFVYTIFGFAAWALSLAGVLKPISLDTLSESPTGLLCGLLTGVCGVAGAAFAIPANGPKGPGPLVAMAMIFLGAAAVNAIGTLGWEWAVLGKQPQVHWLFVVALAALAGAAFVFSRNNPNRPPVPAKAS